MAFDGAGAMTGNLPARVREQLSRRPVQIGLAVLLLLAGSWFYFDGSSESQTPTIQTANVSKGDIEDNVTALGSLQPLEYVDVGAQVSGQLKHVHVDIGDQVEKGKLLAEIDPLVYQSQVDSDNARIADLEAQLKSKQADLYLYQSQYVRYRDLLKGNAVSRDLYDQALNKLETTKAGIDSLKAQISQQKATLSGNMANLSYTKIYAPMSGTVVSQTTQEGQTVVANQSAPTIVRIANLETMTAEAQVAEADVNKLKVGMDAYFTTLGMSDKKWRSTVRQIQPTPTIENNVVLYNVLLDVKNENNLLLPDMTAQVFFVAGAAKDALLVPIAALHGSSGRGYSVTVIKAGVSEERSVTVGVKNRVNAQILTGLSEGESIAISGGNQLAKKSGSGGSRATRIPMPF